MPGLASFLWGGPAALVAAAAAFAISWRLARSSAAAWHTGVIAGFAAGAVALAAQFQGFATAAARLVQPAEAHNKLPLIALAAAAPALIAAATRRSWLYWLTSAALAALAPLWLLWGGRYLPKQELRDAGFATGAWSAGQAVTIFAAVALATLAAMWFWRRAEPKSQPLMRSILAAIAIAGAGVTVASTGSITYAHALALLALALAACTATAWLMKANSGPESAAAPILLAAASLLVLSVCYADLKLWQALALAIIIAISAGWMPLPNARPRTADAIRAALVILPLAAIAGQAAYKAVASQSPTEPASEADVY
jgi:hypothetical protein